MKNENVILDTEIGLY